MDTVAIKDRALTYWRKYRYVLAVLLVGIFLMVLPTGTEEKQTAPVCDQREPSLQDALQEILGQISGAGKVAVLLTQSAGEETIFQVDEDSDNARRETVLVSGAGREGSGLVRQVKAPTYQGAVVVCQGAENAAVRLAVVQAVKSATGLPADRISVLKMK